MRRTVLILETYAEVYARELSARFPDLEIVTAKSRSELPIDLSTIDIMVAFGISIDDELTERLRELGYVE